MSQTQQQQPQPPHITMANQDQGFMGYPQHQQTMPVDLSVPPNLPQHEQPPPQNQEYMYPPASMPASAPLPPPAPVQQVADTAPAAAGYAADPSSATAGASSLDHALLESLFYNEMALLDTTSSPTHSSHQDFISHHLGTTAPQDPTTIVEKEILRDFGVGTPQRGAPVADPATWQAAAPPPQQYQQAPPPYPPAAAAPLHQQQQVPYSAPLPAAQPQQQQQQQPFVVQVDPHATATAAAAAAALMPPVSSTAGVPQTSYPPQQQVVAAVSSSPPPTSSAEVVVPQGKARQLVDQFATLASRLGIDLPDTVLESLTTAAAKNDPSLIQDSSTATAKASSAANSANAQSTASEQQTQASLKTQDENSQNGNSSKVALSVAPTVEELRKTAEEAIAAVTRKRSYEHQDSAGSDGGGNSDGNPSASDVAAASNSKSSKPAYSKRRKKPRLAECEAKLAQLKAENEQLKRHLENVSNKAHKFDKEKEEAGKRIVELQHKNVGPQEMSAAVREFSDMYSDYGANRQQELSFHLEQLQRLVNPTNFTKMGLWTLGQSTRDPKRNPIAGILVKELTITPQQGRKILDQSEKIQKLCDNLKETHALLVKLKALCEKKTQIFQDRMSKCTQILTSQQTVKLISWISEHTQLLESVCPGWGTEQAPLTSSKKPAAK